MKQLRYLIAAFAGTVLDTGQQPLVGAAVLVAGTTTGDVTTPDGTFSLRVPAGQRTVSVTLEEDTMLLEETVVVGYGVQKKVNLTGAVTAVDTKDLEDRTTHNLTDMLQGAVPGLNISTTSGNPGSSGSLNIRGITSINAADPLVLVDGVEGNLFSVPYRYAPTITFAKRRTLPPRR